MDWDNPEERFALVERIGVQAYNKAFEEYVKESTVATVNGHAIRPVNTYYGQLWVCGTTDKAFSTIEGAKDYAAKNLKEA